MDLFTFFSKKIVETPSYVRVRRTDPDTSVNAACNVRTLFLKQKVYEVIKSYGPKGCTANDIIRALPEFKPNSLTNRPANLIADGLIYDTGERRLPEDGNVKQRVIAAICFKN